MFVQITHVLIIVMLLHVWGGSHHAYLSFSVSFQMCTVFLDSVTLPVWVRIILMALLSLFSMLSHSLFGAMTSWSYVGKKHDMMIRMNK